MHLGLRARIVVVMAVISALTLAVAAVTLLSPLDRRLQLNALDNFAVSLRNERGAITALDEHTLKPGDRHLTRVAPAYIRWRLLPAGAATAPWRTALDFRSYQPPREKFTDVYAPWTTLNRPNKPARLIVSTSADPVIT